jgi:hypothetical protein
MTGLLLFVAALVFAYWVFGAVQPIHNKPQAFLGTTGGLWILALAIGIAIVAVLF